MIIRQLALSACLLALTSISTAAPLDLDQGFRQPPPQYRPWAYWWWVNGNVTEDSIRRDLAEMKDKGFSTFLMFDSRGYHDGLTPPPPPACEFMDPKWRALLKFALTEADRLGLKASINLASGAGALHGPWPVGDDAPKKLLWSTRLLEGGKPFAGALPPIPAERSWPVALLAVRLSDSNPPVAEEVVNLAAHLETPTQLTWDIPPGKWTLYRFACALMENHDKDVDILSPDAIERHFRRMAGKILNDAGPLAGKTLTHFYSVSWEGAIPTWTIGFEKMFQKYCGYDPVLWLPAVTGLTVKDAKASQRFLRDYHRALSDAFADNCYGTLQRLCHAAGIVWHSESGGPWNRELPTFKHADQLAFLARTDMPQGEFWSPSRHLNMPAAMTAHTYGRHLAAAEAFTHMQPHWTRYPAMLKGIGDEAFCDGINLLIWHTFTASPEAFGKPGIEYFAGTHLNPNVTWWQQSSAFLQYLARCQLLLQQGRHVADAAVYIGDRPYLHWGRAKKWPSATLTLPAGHAFDLVNDEVLLTRLTVRDGRLCLPEGTSYAMLVVDLEDVAVSPDALKKITDLARAGATVVLGKRRPLSALGLRNYPESDAAVAKLADELWGGAKIAPVRRQFGAGTLFLNTKLEDAFAAIKLLPDFTGTSNYTHRAADNLDLYFVAGTGRADCTFRVSGREPELWDPVSGRTRDAIAWQPTPDNRTSVCIDLPKDGSVFVLFRKPASGPRLAAAPPASVELLGKTATALKTRLWSSGRVDLPTATKPLALEAKKLPPARDLDGAWEVSFDPAWGGPKSITFPKLTPWNEHALDSIKFYSGRATYTQTLDISRAQAARPARLQLGQVMNIAQVRLNGKDLGIVWCDPWTVDLTGALKPGNNKLEIDVVNLWVNRLVGDADLPDDKRLTRTNVRRTPADAGRHARLRGYLSTDPLQPSGLLGPVRIEFAEEKEVPMQ